MIPDSGTTLMMGPAKQLHQLYADLCTRWERCKTTHEGLVAEIKKLQDERQHALGAARLLQTDKGRKQQPFSRDEMMEALKRLQHAMQGGGAPPPEMEEPAGSEHDGGSGLEIPDMSYTFQLLLQNCANFTSGNRSLDGEMPSIFIHVAGVNGNTDTLELKPNTYVAEMPTKIAHVQQKKLMGILPIKEITVSTQNVCQPAFGVMEYPTELNGPVWIMGTPLFYQYQVHYDRGAEPPTMNFVREECGSCIDATMSKNSVKKMSLLKTRESERSVLRKITTEPLEPEMDLALPF